MQKLILLDTGSSTSIFCKATQVDNVRKTQEVMELQTNAGNLITNHKAKLSNWGEIWFNKNAMTNIFSYAEAADCFAITWNQKDDCFIIQFPTGDLKFTRFHNKLYAYLPTKTPLFQFAETVQENKTFYTPRQFAKAKQGKELYIALGTPSVADFKAILAMKGVGNNPVTTKDTDLMIGIFGKDIGSLKGKSTRRKPIPVVDNQIKIPRELIKANQKVVLRIDEMTVNGNRFLATGLG